MDIKSYNTRNFGPRSVKPRRKKRVTSRFWLFLLILVAIIAVVIIAILAFGKPGTNPPAQPTGSNPAATATGTDLPSPTQTGTTEPSPTETTTPPVETGSASVLPEDIQPAASEDSDPADLSLKTNIMAFGKQEITFERENPVNFPEPENYTKLEGVTTFRGNNYRTGGSYGTADIKQKKLEIVWDVTIGKNDTWTGVGWSGQPLIVKWPESTRNAMNIISSKKSKEDLKEVIYPTMDGKVYFLDLEDGKKTRNPINIGTSTKGTASIDPRGYPILYVGQGLADMNGDSIPVYFRIYNLLDQKLLWKFGGKDPFAYRKAWTAYDSSPLIDPNSDTLVEGGENGVLYTVKLGTEYDEAAKKLTMNPEGKLVKYRYTTPEYANDSSSKRTRWYGIENSVVGWRNYAFFTDNGGTLQCVDLNTMKVVYAVDVTDDSDTTMPLEVDAANNTFYLYTACEVDKQKGLKNSMGKTHLRKIDGLTGKILWQKSFDAYKDGGTLTSPVLGKGDISDLIIYSMCDVPVKSTVDGEVKMVKGGRIIAYNRETGDEVWRNEYKGTNNDFWSSPLAIYDESGKGYIVQCDRKGYMKLFDGKSGDLLDTLDLCSGSRIDATPAAYGNMIVVGTRSQKIFGIKIK